MNIQEAARLSHETGRGIYRKYQQNCPVRILPTNTIERCILFCDPPDENGGLHGCWWPNLDDLLADDWLVH